MLLTIAVLASLALLQGVGPSALGLPRVVLTDLPLTIRAEFQRVYEAAAAAPDDAAAVGRLAVVLHAHEQYVSAAVCYRLVRRLDPGAFRWVYLDAVVQSELGNDDAATRTLREALALNPEYLPARLRLAAALTRTGDLDASRAEYSRLVRRDPGLALAHYGLGRVLSLLGDTAGAIDQYHRAIQGSPQFGAAHYQLGLALRAAGRPSEGAAHFDAYRRWGALRPSSPDPVLEAVTAVNRTARSLLGEAARLERGGRLEESIGLHLKALGADATAAQAHVNLIALYGRRGDFAAAEQHYLSAVALGSSLADAHYNYGVLLASAQRFADAGAAFRQALDANPFHPGAHSNLGALLARDGRLEEAAAHYRQAVSNNPVHAAARHKLAVLLVAIGRVAEARGHLERALQSAIDEGDERLAGMIRRQLQDLPATAQ